VRLTLVIKLNSKCKLAGLSVFVGFGLCRIGFFIIAEFDGIFIAGRLRRLSIVGQEASGDKLGDLAIEVAVLQREPLQIAFRCLHSDDEHLQGTALEYLEGVLPAPIRQRLWPFLERRAVRRPARPHDEVIANLLRSNHSILLNLEDLRRRQGIPVAGDVVAV